jgi:hypothetical protein
MCSNLVEDCQSRFKGLYNIHFLYVCQWLIWLINYNKLQVTSLQATERLKITAPKLCKLQIANGIIPVNHPLLLCSCFSSIFFLSMAFIYPIHDSRHLLQIVIKDETWVFAGILD